METARCSRCGAEFMRDNPRRMFCSPKCKVAACRLRGAKRAAQGRKPHGAYRPRKRF